MNRFVLLAPALGLTAALVVAFAAYCALRAAGRARVGGVKHNEVFGPFLAGFLIWLLGPVERVLVGRVSPNAVTALSLALCALTGVATARGYLAGAVWLYAFAGILDVLDGRIARHGTPTRAGALIDSVSDRWGELCVFAGYAWYLHDSPWLLAVIAAFGGSMMVSYTRARAESLGQPLASGLMQRAERIVLVAVGTLLAAWLGDDGSGVVAPVLGVTMLVCGLAASATAINRAIVAYRALTRLPAQFSAPPARAEPQPFPAAVPVEQH